MVKHSTTFNRKWILERWRETYKSANKVSLLLHYFKNNIVTVLTNRCCRFDLCIVTVLDSSSFWPIIHYFDIIPMQNAVCKFVTVSCVVTLVHWYNICNINISFLQPVKCSHSHLPNQPVPAGSVGQIDYHILAGKWSP